MNKLIDDFFTQPFFTINNLKSLLWNNKNNLESYLRIDNLEDFYRYNHIIEHIESAKILIDAGLNINYKDGFLPYSKSIELMNLLINAGADLNKALARILVYNDKTKIKLLLDNGANPNIILNKGFNKTLLSYAFNYSNIEIVKLLVEYGASFDLMLSLDENIYLTLIGLEQQEKIDFYNELELKLLSNSKQQEVYLLCKK